MGRRIFRRVGFFLAVGLLILLGTIGVFLRPQGGVAQPIAFNHKLHVVEVGLQCTHCHSGAETGPFATLPATATCLGCHEVSLSENPEEAKVREYGGEKGEIPWRRLTRQPDHVYFSHQRHVVFAEIACERCHGKMEERTAPPSAAPLELSMDDCLECHAEKKASVDCISCHR